MSVFFVTKVGDKVRPAESTWCVKKGQDTNKQKIRTKHAKWNLTETRQKGMKQVYDKFIELMKQLMYMEQIKHVPKKNRARRWRIDSKTKKITVGQRLWGSCRGWRCPRARPWTNQIVTESKIGQMLSWNKLGMFDFLFLCTFGSWRRRWCVTNILIPRRLQRVRSRKADTIFSSVMCFLFFLSLSSISNRYPSCCPWSPEPGSPSHPCGLPSGFWRQEALTPW